MPALHAVACSLDTQETPGLYAVCSGVAQISVAQIRFNEDKTSDYRSITPTKVPICAGNLVPYHLYRQSGGVILLLLACLKKQIIDRKRVYEGFMRLWSCFLSAPGTLFSGHLTFSMFYDLTRMIPEISLNAYILSVCTPFVSLDETLPKNDPLRLIGFSTGIC